MQKPTIALIGATGKAGSYILQQLLTAGYPVKALIRNTSTLPTTHTLLTIITGDMVDLEANNLSSINQKAAI